MVIKKINASKIVSDENMNSKDGEYFPSEVNMTIALKESVLITAGYASAEHGTEGRTIF